MAANIDPIFTKAGDIQWGATDGNTGAAGPLKTANTAKDGTGVVLTIFTSDATNGGFVQKVRWRPAGTNIATVGRLFINNSLTSSTLANNVFYDDITLAAVTNSEVAAQVMQEQVLNLALPAGYKLNVTIGTTVAAGWCVSCVGGKY